MIVAMAAGISACSIKNPFVKEDSRTIQEYQAESVSFRITVTFQTSSTSSICQLSMSPSGSSWKINNAVAFCMDIQNVNEIFLEGKKQDEELNK